MDAMGLSSKKQPTVSTSHSGSFIHNLPEIPKVPVLVSRSPPPPNTTPIPSYTPTPPYGVETVTPVLTWMTPNLDETLVLISLTPLTSGVHPLTPPLPNTHYTSLPVDGTQWAQRQQWYSVEDDRLAWC